RRKGWRRCGVRCGGLIRRRSGHGSAGGGDGADQEQAQVHAGSLAGFGNAPQSQGWEGAMMVDSLAAPPLYAPPRRKHRLRRFMFRARPRITAMKVRSSLKSLKTRHRDCKVVRRKGRVYVINKTDPRFKARQG